VPSSSWWVLVGAATCSNYRPDSCSAMWVDSEQAPGE
jgi:hypothetical protein